MSSHVGSASSSLIEKPSSIEYANMRFLVMNAPTDSTLPSYIDVLKKKHTVCVVRACEPTYDSKPLEDAGIRVIDLPFSDGQPPPAEIITKWLELVESTFSSKSPPKSARGNEAKEVDSDDDKKRVIAVHCVAGLGRAPMLVAIAIVEQGLGALDAIELIRKKRRGALNRSQIEYLQKYKPTKSASGDGCSIM